MKHRLRWVAAAWVLAVTVLAPLAWLGSQTPDRLLVDAMPRAEGLTVSGRVTRFLALTAIGTWRTCPAEAVPPESVIGFVVNGNLVPAVGDSRERMRRLLNDLADAGCDVNAYSQFGNTPLMNAALYGDAWAVDLLLSMGADPTRVARAADPRHASRDTPARQGWIGLNALGIARRAAARAPAGGADHAAVIASLERAVQPAAPPGR